MILASGDVDPDARVVETPSGTYRPIVVDFSRRDGRERLEQIRAHILAGTFESWLELVVLPLYGKEKGAERSAFVEEVVRFQMELCRAEKISSRLPAATLILSNKMIDRKRLDAMWEEIKMLDIIEIAREKGIEEGITKGKILGISEGITKGKIQNARETILELLMDKFGHVPEHIQQEIDRTESLVNLKALLRHIHRCADMEAFEALLNRIQPASSKSSTATGTAQA